VNGDSFFSALLLFVFVFLFVFLSPFFKDRFP
jgi:hypothetical protein